MIESIQLNTSMNLMEALTKRTLNGSLILSQAQQMLKTSILERQQELLMERKMMMKYGEQAKRTENSIYWEEMAEIQYTLLTSPVVQLQPQAVEEKI